MNVKTTEESNRRWGLALLLVGVIGLLLGSWSLIVGPSAPSWSKGPRRSTGPGPAQELRGLRQPWTERGFE